ncbi:MAG: RNA polymerase sigma-70 factor [Acidobacteria bacterium]|nr:RNA polymerase sigma-70 factor [Acidobacteriota bacterium]
MSNSTGSDSQYGSDLRSDALRRQARIEAFSQHRALLFSIAYQMLGSAADAEDILQETFIRWQQAAEQEVHSPRAFLVTILSRLCIQYLESARVKREEYVGEWLPEPVLTGDRSDPSWTSQMQESLSMAFLLLLEQLTPAERAAFLLYEVFEYDYGDIANILGKSEPNCRQLVRRARQYVTSGRPRFTATPEEHRRLLDEFLAAASSGDMQSLIALLSDEVVLYSDGGGKQRAALNPIHGPDHVARFLIGARHKTQAGVTSRIEEVNGQPTIVYSPPSGGVGCTISVQISGGLIRNIYVVTNPDKLGRLGKASFREHLM